MALRKRNDFYAKTKKRDFAYALMHFDHPSRAMDCALLYNGKAPEFDASDKWEIKKHWGGDKNARASAGSEQVE